MPHNPLTPEEERVIVHKGTEHPFTGEYDSFFADGTYVCRRCNTPLYHSDRKYFSGCGWPSFEEEIPGAVTHVPDPDGLRTEIICNTCQAHLGHVFINQPISTTGVRHCVNSISLKFIPTNHAMATKQTIVFGGGCFWCIQAVLQLLRGVEKVTSGYTGGTTENPTYEEVCTKNTGHVEAVQVEFDPAVITLDDLLSVFFSSHDPTTKNRQGNDVGPQYRSAIFYTTDEQKQGIEAFIKKLTDEKTFAQPIVTEVLPLGPFYAAERYHQDYYRKNPDDGYCQYTIDPKIKKLRDHYKHLLKTA